MPKDLRSFLKQLASARPDDLLRVDRRVSVGCEPDRLDETATS